MINDCGLGNWFSAFGAVEDGNGYTPNPLPRNTPIGSALQHVAHGIHGPCGHPLDLFDFAQSRCPQRLPGRSRGVRIVLGEIAAVATVFVFLNERAMGVIHCDEPLRRSSKNHWILATPAVRIAMLVFLGKQQHAAFRHELDYLVIRVEHSLAGKVFHFRREPTRVVDRAIDVQTVAFADYEIVVTMTRRRMNTSCTGLTPRRFLLRLADIELRFGVSFTTESYVLAYHQQRWTVEPRMAALQSIQLCAGKACEHLWSNVFASSIAFTQIAFGSDGLKQLGSNNVNFIPVFERRIFKIRMNSNTEIGRQRPGRGSPDHHEDFSTGKCRID